MDFGVDNVVTTVLWLVLIGSFFLAGKYWMRGRQRREALLDEIANNPPLRIGADGSCPHCGVSLLVAPTKNLTTGEEGVTVFSRPPGDPR